MIIEAIALTTKNKARLLIADSLTPCDLDGGGGDGRSCDLRKKIHHHSSSSCSPTSRSTPSSEALDQVGDLRAAPAHPTGGMGGHTTLPTRSANIRPNGNSINFNGNNTEDLYAKVKCPHTHKYIFLVTHLWSPARHQRLGTTCYTSLF